MCMSVHPVVSDSVRPPGLWPARLLCPWDSPGKNIGEGCHFFLQGNLPDPGIEPVSPVSLALAGGFFTTEPPGKPLSIGAVTMKNSIETLQKKLKKLSYDLAIPLLDIYSKKTKTLTWKDICTHLVPSLHGK